MFMILVFFLEIKVYFEIKKLLKLTPDLKKNSQVIKFINYCII